MIRAGADRILVLTGICLLLIFLGFRELAFNAISSNELGQIVLIEAKPPSAHGEDPFKVLESAATTRDTLVRFDFDRSDLEFAAETFFSAAELSTYADRRSTEELFRRIAPPLRLRWEPHGLAIELAWDRNPANDAIEREAAGNSLLSTGYRVYRWRVGETPRVIATGSLSQTRHLDEGLGARGGTVFYAVLTVLEGRIGEKDTLIESERSEVLTVVREDAFDVRLLGDATAGDEPRVRIEVTVATEEDLASATFDVGVGDTIGGPREVAGRTIDFHTGLEVAAIDVIAETRDETIRHPLFNPDGSRAFDETGFLFREEVRKIPVQRLEVRCDGDRGATRSLSVDRP